MRHDIAEQAPTSTATTGQTEPEVVAGISSAEGSPDLPTAIRVGGTGLAPWQLAMLLAGGIAIGYGVTRWLRTGRF